MALTAKILGMATLTSTVADIYTAPAATKTRVGHIIISNGSTAGTITLQVLDNSASATKKLLNAKAIAANDVVEIFDLILEAGDKLQASAATTTAADITVFGFEES